MRLKPPQTTQIRGTIYYQMTVDYPDEYNNGYHVMLDTRELVTVRWEQVDRVTEGA